MRIIRLWPKIPCTLGWIACAAMLVAVTVPAPISGQEKDGRQIKPAKILSTAWTLNEARDQLQLYPRDAYLQYVALQLAQRAGQLEEISVEVERLLGNEAQMQRNERANRVDLFSIFTGALAVQESLQLDAMRGERLRRVPRPEKPRDLKGDNKAFEQAERERQAAEEDRRKRQVTVAELTGPTIKSHPWEQMLAGKKPDISPLARCVPEDFYFVEFRSLNKLIQVTEVGNLWGTHLFNQTSREARTQLVGERLKKQLAIETNPLARPFYDLVVEEMAVAGSDLFAAEGSDLTVLLRFKQPEVFKARMDGFLADAEKSRADAKRTQGEYLGVPYVHVATPDRAVHVFSAYPTKDLHLRSNSPVAFRRILEAIGGKKEDGQAVRRLGDTSEFAYIRTLMPRGAAEEDGFIYLSDPFIRRMVGPQVRLTERRRMLCYNHLRMIGHAALLYRTEHGKGPESLEALTAARCAPSSFGQGTLACPHGGKYSLSADGLVGVCSHHGHADFLTPCCEIPVNQVTGEEADEYRAFVQEYSQYWRTYFDPIAVRVQVTPERYRLETIVLPLINNSIYDGLAATLGGKPEALDGLPVPKRNIFSVAVRLNKEQLLQQAGLVEQPPVVGKRGKPGPVDARCIDNLKQIGLALHNYHDTFGKFPAVANFDKQGKPLLSWRVHLLPYLEQDNLYKEFHLDEPWDSDHNKKLIARLPAIYRCPAQETKESGKTTYLAPVGAATMFTGDAKGLRLADVTDGTSNTIFLVDAAHKQAVIWTKPEDLAFDPKKPLEGLVDRHPGGFLTLFVDGTVRYLSESIDEEKLRRLIARNDGQEISWQDGDQIFAGAFDGSQRGIFGFVPDELSRLNGKEFLTKGVGNQVGLHIYDGDQLFDFNLPEFLGMAVGQFNGRSRMLQNEMLPISFLIASLNSPVYISIPVRDAKVVDEFLNRLDATLATLSRRQEGPGWFGLSQDFYQFSLDKQKAIRTHGFRIGPVKWRFHWGRIGNGLYVASKPFILEDLLALESGGTKTQTSDSGPPAHALIRLRPKNWNQVLNDYRLGWAENNREACVNNIGPLSSIARSVAGKPSGSVETADRTLHEFADRLHGVHFFCPERGQYVRSADGKSVSCSVHGTALAPRQPRAPADSSPASKLLHDFTGLTVTLTFLEDGLHAVLVIDRK